MERAISRRQHTFNFCFCGRGIDVIFSSHQSFDALPRHVVGLAFALAFGPDLGVVHSSAMEKIRVGRTGLKSGNGDGSVAQFVTNAVGEGEVEGLCGGVNRFAGRNHFASDGSSEEHAALIASNHVSHNMLGQVNRTGAMQVHHVQFFIEIGLEERPPTPYAALI